MAETFESRILQMSCIDLILITFKSSLINEKKKKKRLRKKVHSGNCTFLLKPYQGSKIAFLYKKKKKKKFKVCGNVGSYNLYNYLL